jgi:hypothetical protein
LRPFSCLAHPIFRRFTVHSGFFAVRRTNSHFSRPASRVTPVFLQDTPLFAQFIAMRSKSKAGRLKVTPSKHTNNPLKENIMNIAKNMEAIFVAAVITLCALSYPTDNKEIVAAPQTASQTNVQHNA